MLELLHATSSSHVRLRYRVRSLQRNRVLAALIESELRKIPGVQAGCANPITGTLLVRFAADGSRGAIEAALAHALRWPSVPGVPVARDRTGRRRLLRAVARVIARRTRRAERTGIAPAAVVERGSSATPDVPFHALSIAEICEAIGVDDAQGVSPAEAERKRAVDGPNAVTPPARRSELRILFDQLASTPTIMLGVSAGLSIATGGLGDAAAILAVVVINAAIGYATESGAERTIAALTQSGTHVVKVRRRGAELAVPFEEVVRGDLLVLEGGAIVPADARLVSAQDLTVDESALTGESMPVRKEVAALPSRDAPLAERNSMVYRGTLVTGGSGQALVVATGDHTEVGRIQSLASGVEPRLTPMQQQLDHLGRQVAIGAGIACAATLGVGLLRGQAALPLFRTAISLAVAAVPEALPTVAMTTLALGLNRLRAGRVIVRQLAAVETLGAVQVVCFDKTGTLTINRMTVVAGALGAAPVAVAKEGGFTDGDGQPIPIEDSRLRALLRVAALCSDVAFEAEQGERKLRGSPTESALVQAALDAGFDVFALREEYPRESAQHRAEGRNYMCTSHVTPHGRLQAVKGRPSEVLAMCAFMIEEGERRPLTERDRAQIEAENGRLAGNALRVLGLAYGEGACEGEPASLVWAGMLAMEDPPRPDLPELLATFRRAGVRPLMITGDQSATAYAVSAQVGLSTNAHLEGVDSTALDKMDPVLLCALAQRAQVFSRVSPAHKLQIVQALQRAGSVVAMTGDGVNDGPALKAADLGIAMGGGGPTAAAEVAHVVLQDDDLRRLLGAIEQGRTIYEDIRKAVHFILATNLGEIFYTLAAAAGVGVPLTPMQLLWINLLTDIVPEIALAVEPPESDVMARPPRDPEQPMFERRDRLRIVGEGAVITASALFAQLSARGRAGGAQAAGSVGFTALTMAQLLHAISSRSETHTIFDREGPRGRTLPIAVASMIALQVAANLLPGVRALLGTRPLSLADWTTVLIAAGVPLAINEGVKVALRPAAANDQAGAERASTEGGDLRAAAE